MFTTGRNEPGLLWDVLDGTETQPFPLPIEVIKCSRGTASIIWRVDIQRSGQRNPTTSTTASSQIPWQYHTIAMGTDPIESTRPQSGMGDPDAPQFPLAPMHDN